MKFSPSTVSSLVAMFIAAAGFIGSVSAQATVDACTVVHTSSGNTFSIGVVDVPDVSQSTICGSSNSDILSAASSFSTTVVGGISCGTDNDANTMSLVVTFNKQSPSVELSALQNGITAAFGSQGVNFPGSVCDLSGIPTRK